MVIEDIFVEELDIDFISFLTNIAELDEELDTVFIIDLMNKEAIETAPFLVINACFTIEVPIDEELIKFIKKTTPLDNVAVILDELLNDLNTFLTNTAVPEDDPVIIFDIDFRNTLLLEAELVITFDINLTNTTVLEDIPVMVFDIDLMNTEVLEVEPEIVFIIKFIITAVTRVDANL